MDLLILGAAWLILLPLGLLFRTLADISRRCPDIRMTMMRTFWLRRITLNLWLVRLLRRRGRDERTSAERALSNGVAHGETHNVEILLRRGTRPDASTGYGPPPLLIAVFRRDPTIVRLLLEAGANPDDRLPATGATSLMLAVCMGSSNLVKLLLHHEASPNIGGLDKMTPLMYAVCHGFDEIAALLLAHGADKYQEAANGYNAFHYATKYRRTSIIALFEQHDEEQKNRT